MNKKKDRIDFATLILLIVAAFVVIMIIAGTVWAFAGGHVPRRGSPRTPSLFTSRGENPPVQDLVTDGTAVFTEIGTLRAPTKDIRPVTVVLSVYFPYPAQDLALEEELVSKSRAVRRVILEWFSSRSLEEIRRLSEKEVKASLLENINALLVLGHIETLYFGDYLVLE